MAYYHFETETEERQRKNKETAKHCKRVFFAESYLASCPYAYGCVCSLNFSFYRGTNMSEIISMFQADGIFYWGILAICGALLISSFPEVTLVRIDKSNRHYSIAHSSVAIVFYLFCFIGMWLAFIQLLVLVATLCEYYGNWKKDNAESKLQLDHK